MRSLVLLSKGRIVFQWAEQAKVSLPVWWYREEEKEATTTATTKTTTLRLEGKHDGKGIEFCKATQVSEAKWKAKRKEERELRFEIGWPES